MATTITGIDGPPSKKVCLESPASPGKSHGAAAERSPPLSTSKLALQNGLENTRKPEQSSHVHIESNDADVSSDATFAGPDFRRSISQNLQTNTTVEGLDMDEARTSATLTMPAVDESEVDSSDISSSDSSSDLKSDSSADDSDDDSDDEPYTLLDPETQARILMGQFAAEDSEDDEHGEGKKDGKNSNKNQAPKIYVEKPSVVVTPDMQIIELGLVDGVIEDQLLIKGHTIAPDMASKPRVLDTESLLCLENRMVIGVVFDLIGRVKEPHYLVMFNNAAEIEELGLTTGVKIFYVPDHAIYAFPEELRKMKFTDASKQDDEELDEKEAIYFSDDEAERAYKKKLKQQKESRGGGTHVRGNEPAPRGRGQSVNHGRKPGPETSYPADPMQYDDSDAEEGLYQPLRRPNLMEHPIPARPPIQHPHVTSDASRGTSPTFGSRGRGHGRGRGGFRGGRGNHAAYESRRDPGSEVSNLRNNTSSNAQGSPAGIHAAPSTLPQGLNTVSLPPQAHASSPPAMPGQTLVQSSAPNGFSQQGYWGPGFQHQGASQTFQAAYPAQQMSSYVQPPPGIHAYMNPDYFNINQQQAPQVGSVVPPPPPPHFVHLSNPAPFWHVPGYQHQQHQQHQQIQPQQIPHQQHQQQYQQPQYPSQIQPHYQQPYGQNNTQRPPNGAYDPRNPRQY